MLGDVAGRVRLDEQVEVTCLRVGRDGRVGAHNFFGLAGDGGSEGDVLADGEAKDVGGPGEGEAIARYSQDRKKGRVKAIYMAVL
jgi:hypothetical protein